MKRLGQRLARLERALLRPRFPDSANLRRAWCIAQGHDPESVLVGFGGPLVIILPPDGP